MCLLPRRSKRRTPSHKSTGTTCTRISSRRPATKNCCCTFAPIIAMSLSPAISLDLASALSMPSLTKVKTGPIASLGGTWSAGERIIHGTLPSGPSLPPQAWLFSYVRRPIMTAPTLAGFTERLVGVVIFGGDEAIKRHAHIHDDFSHNVILPWSKPCLEDCAVPGITVSSERGSAAASTDKVDFTTTVCNVSFVLPLSSANVTVRASTSFSAVLQDDHRYH